MLHFDGFLDAALRLSKGAYAVQQGEAAAEKRGMWQGLVEAPWDWRERKRQKGGTERISEWSGDFRALANSLPDVTTPGLDLVEVGQCRAGHFVIRLQGLVTMLKNTMMNESYDG